MQPSDIPGRPPLPDWVDPTRPQWERQVAVVNQIMDAYADGAEVVFLDAPTGSGKTLIAEMVRRLLAVPRSLYVCNTKSLQDQFLRDFPYAAVLKGRSNYPTENFPDLFRDRFQPVTAADCTKGESGEGEDGQAEYACWACDHIASCPYEVAKQEVLASQLGVLNTAYFLTEANYVGGVSGYSKESGTREGFVVVDECDTLESALMGHVQLSVGERLRKELGLGMPAKKTVESAWVDWVAEAIETVRPQVGLHARRVRELRGDVMEATTKRERDKLTRQLLKETRLSRQVTGLSTDLKTVKAGLEDGRWVYTGYEKGGETVTFRPVRVDTFGHSHLFKHAAQWLLMSATIISPDELITSLGAADKPWALVSMTSTFPAERRKLHVVPVAYMVASQKAEAWPKMAAALFKVLTKHPDERVLVHAVSYELAEYLAKRVGPHRHRVVMYTDAAGRDDALAAYLAMPNAVLIAPSFDRGIDLPDDKCRVVVVAKIPYPYLGDKQVSARLHSSGGELWYQVQSIRSLVQMTGRGVRHDEDHCTMYVLDGSFISLWKKWGHLIPTWWSSAIDWSGQALKQYQPTKETASA